MDLREKESGLPIQQIPDQQNLSCEMQRNRICLSVKECTEKMTKADKARGYKHMTFREAAVLARDARVKEMWLTHYSPSLVRPDEFMDKVREIFPNAYPGKDGKSLELNFEE